MIGAIGFVDTAANGTFPASVARVNREHRDTRSSRLVSDKACGHCVRTLHAEQNAIIQAAYHGVSVADSTIYVTHQPCLTCAKMIINAGIKRVVYAGHYPDENAVAFLTAAGVVLEHHARPAALNDEDNEAL